jgi:hypothetical protein
MNFQTPTPPLLWTSIVEGLYGCGMRKTEWFSGKGLLENLDVH